MEYFLVDARIKQTPANTASVTKATVLSSGFKVEERKEEKSGKVRIGIWVGIAEVYVGKKKNAYVS